MMGRPITVHRRFGLETRLSTATPEDTVVALDGQAHADDRRRLGYAGGRTDTAHRATHRDRRDRRDIRVPRIGRGAAEAATGTRDLRSRLPLWRDGGHDPADTASRPLRARSRRPRCWRPPTKGWNTGRRLSFRRSRAHPCDDCRARHRPTTFDSRVAQLAIACALVDAVLRLEVVDSRRPTPPHCLRRG
jgi:hypothetical protein